MEIWSYINCHFLPMRVSPSQGRHVKHFPFFSRNSGRCRMPTEPREMRLAAAAPRFTVRASQTSARRTPQTWDRFQVSSASSERRCAEPICSASWTPRTNASTSGRQRALPCCPCNNGELPCAQEDDPIVLNSTGEELVPRVNRIGRVKAKLHRCLRLGESDTCEQWLVIPSQNF